MNKEIDEAIKNYMKREENDTRSVVQHMNIGEYESPLLLVAPQGGITLLRFHIVAPVDIVLNPSQSFEADIAIHDVFGVDRALIHLENCDTGIIPFNAHTRLTWPVVGRFDIGMEELEHAILILTKTGNPSGIFGMQLDYMLAGR